MRELFIKYFGRFLALLGCTTVVTACYGVPVESETYWIEGLVRDAESGEPIKGIRMTVLPGAAAGSTSGVDAMKVAGSPLELYSGKGGEFSGEGTAYQTPELYRLECLDVDGTANGSYEPSFMMVPGSEAADIVVEMTPSTK